MAIGWFRVEHFRCLGEVEIELDPRANLFVGPNASGKTSLLEAAYFLSRGRSFRTRRRDALIAYGADSFVVAGRSTDPTRQVVLGARASRSATEWRSGGEPAAGAADLAEQFPAQVIEPEVHKLLEEGPGRRRRFVDWGVFHVEPSFLGAWRRYHQALRQRNAALKEEARDVDLAAWEQELATQGQVLAKQRANYLDQLSAPLADIGEALLGLPIGLKYAPGWDLDRPLLETLEAMRQRDRRYRSTQVGPHRADIVVEVAGQAAKDHVSRGQQKLVAAGLMLAQVELQERHRPGRSALLLDDPAAELDRENLGRLMRLVQRSPGQIWITGLHADIPGITDSARMFHVEQGRIRGA